MSDSALLTAWSRLLLGSLAEAGVRQVIISPGSRCTPLVLAATRTPGLQIVNLLDERDAAFFALGQARVSGRPSLLICSSGSAGAHYLPAFIEAAQAGLPVIALTADRPYELQGCAAPQTVDQRDLFGRFARSAVDLGMPDGSESALRALRRVAAQAVHQSMYPEPGPVHLNFRADKPLEPSPGPALDEALARVDALLARPAPRAHAPAQSPDELALSGLQAELDRARRPLVVAGPGPLLDEMSRELILSWCSEIPLLAEGPSQLRWGSGRVIGAFDLILRDPELARALRPDLVIQLGMPPVSGQWERWMGELPALRRFVIHPHGWSDPQSTAEILRCAPADALRALRPPEVGPTWASAWAAAELNAWRAVDQVLAADPRGELSLARAAVQALPAGALLVLANSLPIRDVDLAAPPGGRPLGVLCQRGANGIDGLVSGAAGAAAASGRPTLLLIGDVSLLHDLGGLLAASRVEGPLVLVVIDNGGGQIFAQLPVARVPHLRADELAQFTTPHGASLSAAAAVFGLPFAEVGDAPALTREIGAALARRGATLIAARTDAHSHGRQVAAVLERMRA